MMGVKGDSCVDKCAGEMEFQGDLMRKMKLNVFSPSH